MRKPRPSTADNSTHDQHLCVSASRSLTRVVIASDQQDVCILCTRIKGVSDGPTCHGNEGSLTLFVKRDEQVTVEELREAAARKNMTIPAKDENDYLELVRAADIAVKHVEHLPSYIDPRLVPKTGETVEDLVKAREVLKPTPEDNPLKAWSHKVSSPSILASHHLTILTNIGRA